MDFRNRNDQPVSSGRVTPTGSAQNFNSSSTAAKDQKKEGDNNNMFRSGPNWLRWVYVALLFSITVLCIGVAYFLSTYNPNESKYIINSKYQAVFLSNGQVYFGKIASLNGRYIDLRSIFYLNSQSQTDQASQTSSSSNQFTLVKLGCELHGPYDQMIINHSNITFWENLRDDSQVVKSIKQWQQQNPKGQDCTTTTAGTGQSATGTNGTAAAATTTTKSSTTSTTKQ